MPSRPPSFTSSSSAATHPPIDNSNSSNGDSCSHHDNIFLNLDLVKAARNYLSLLTIISDSTLLHHRLTLLRSIRRYEEQWMPLISDLSRDGSVGPMLLPPVDVQWIWLCHCFRPKAYREYCVSRFGVVVEKPTIFDEENEEYAYSQCRKIWTSKYPSEPFDLVDTVISEEEDDGWRDGRGGGNDLLGMVENHRDLCSNFCDHFVFETVYLASARRRYKCFLYVCKKFKGISCQLVPASDILLMWQAHQGFPRTYERDIERIGIGDMEKIAVCYEDSVKDEDVQKTRRIWEEEFNEPYEKAGSCLRPVNSPSRVFFYWGSFDADVNRRYKNLRPRSKIEVLVFLKGRWDEGRGAVDNTRTTLQLQTLRCHRVMKLAKPTYGLCSDSWRKVWQLYCELGTRGVTLTLQKQTSGCLHRKKVIKELMFEWNDLLRATLLSLSKDLGMHMKGMVTITPPVQAPYLLKCVPDRVTDDDGAMISEVILRMNGYHPQKGRWLSRTVIDNSRRECFVIRIRIGEGFWRRGAETPKAVKWENRIIEVHEGRWSYVSGSVGNAPKKIVGSAAPKEKNTQEKKVAWSLSTGDLLTIRWEGGLEFQLENDSSNGMVRLLKGRKLQYQVNDSSDSKDFEKEEEQFLTLVRSTPENPSGKATALLNWRLFAVEFLPEEDAVLVLLLCTIVVRTISEITGEDVGRLLVRRRVREGEAGMRDWGSVALPCSSCPHLNPWFWNAAQVLTSAEVNDTRQPSYWYSPADGKEDMYKQAILR